MNHWRAACEESLQARFGGGPTENGRSRGTSLAAYPTRWGAASEVGTSTVWRSEHRRETAGERAPA